MQSGLAPWMFVGALVLIFSGYPVAFALGGTALFYLRGVTPPEVATTEIYRGAVPFILIQLLGITVASVSEDWPEYAEGDLPGDPNDVPLPPPSAESKVEGGTGFLGGVFRRTVEVRVQP